MDRLIRPAGYAALVVFLAFAVHNVNGAYIEPKYLGFASYADYADLARLANASRSLPWLASGLGHVATGFAMVVLAAGVHALLREAAPASALLLLATGWLASAGFLLLGLSHVIGRQALFLLTDANPQVREAAYLTASLSRIWFNGLAQVALGWFAVQLSWSGLRTGTLSRWFCRYGYLSGAAGLLMALAYVPVYLFTVPGWALWLGVALLRRPPVGGTATADAPRRAGGL